MCVCVRGFVTCFIENFTDKHTHTSSSHNISPFISSMGAEHVRAADHHISSCVRYLSVIQRATAINQNDLIEKLRPQTVLHTLHRNRVEDASKIQKQLRSLLTLTPEFSVFLPPQSRETFRSNRQNYAGQINKNQ